MGTVLRRRGFRFMIRLNDHRPPHVHAIKDRGQTKILLGSKTERPEIWKNWMADKDARTALEIVAQEQEYFLGEWEKIHGELDI